MSFHGLRYSSNDPYATTGIQYVWRLTWNQVELCNMAPLIDFLFMSSPWVLPCHPVSARPTPGEKLWPGGSFEHAVVSSRGLCYSSSLCGAAKWPGRRQGEDSSQAAEVVSSAGEGDRPAKHKTNTGPDRKEATRPCWADRVQCSPVSSVCKP